MIEYIDRVTAAGGHMFGQTHARGVSTITSFRSIFPFDSQPVWKDFRKLPLDQQLAGLRDPETRQALADAVKNAVYGRSVGAEARPPVWEEYYYYDKPMPPWRSLAEIAAERGVHPIEALIDLGAEKNLDALFLQFLTRAPDEETAAVLRHPSSIMTFSDSGAHVGQIADSSIQSYLIAHFCRETGLLSLPEAIEMMTSRAARGWGFDGRGVIKEGSIADINIFDPETFGPLMPKIVHDLPGGARRLVQGSTGMKATLVAGEIVIENSKHTGALPGKLIRRTEH